MTIYYVNPTSGSNANSGLSWGAAWKWPPGNGATVNPGDEIRFAKSTEATSTPFYIGRNYTSTPYGTSGSHYVAAITNTWVATATGVTVIPTYGGLSIAAGTAVPANTKLGYVPISDSQTAYAGVFMTTYLSKIPTGVSGTYLKFVLCSDALGNTPVLTLNGGTWFSPTAFGTMCKFLFNAATAQSITFASIAIYSINAFTVDSSTADSATIKLSRATSSESNFIAFTPTQSTLALVGDTFSTLANYTEVSWTRDEPDFHGMAVHLFRNGTLISGSPDPTPRFGKTSFTGGVGANINPTIYRSLPEDASGLYDVPLTYAGTSGARIKFSGGWNTSTNLQDGYTNLAIGRFWFIWKKGAFIFSSGGSYIDFERFHCLQTHLVYYDFALSAVTGLRFFRCTLGTKQTSYHWATGATYIPPSIIAAPSAAGSVAVTGFYMEKCNVWDWFSAATGPSWAINVTAVRYPPSTFVFDSVDLVDCVISDFGQHMTQAVVPSGFFRVRSSVPGSISSQIIQVTQADSSSAFWQLSAGSTASVLFQDLIFSALGAVKLYCVAADAGAASSSSVTVRNIVLSGPSSLTNAINEGCIFGVGDFRNTTIDGYGFVNPHRNNVLSGSGAMYLQVSNSATFAANNPTATLSIGGPVFTATSSVGTGRYNGEALYLIYPPATIDCSTSPRPYSLSTDPLAQSWPGLVIQSWRTLSLSNFDGSFIRLALPAYTVGTYWPNIPIATLTNCNGAVYNTSCLGTVRAFGGIVEGVGPRSYSEGSVAPHTGGVMAYGRTIDNVYEAVNLIGVGGNVFDSLDRRTIGVKIKGTDIKFGTGGPTFGIANRPLSLTLDESATFFAYIPPDLGFSNHGMLFRKNSGLFTLIHSLKKAEVSSNQLNSSGKRPISLSANLGLSLARVDLKQGQTVMLTLKATLVSSAVTVGSDYIALMIPPCTAYTSTIDNHYRKKIFPTGTTSATITCYVSPQNTGFIYVNVYANVDVTIDDFTAQAV